MIQGDTPQDYYNFIINIYFIQYYFFQDNTYSELVRVYTAHKQNLELISGQEEQLIAALPSLNIIDCKHFYVFTAMFVKQFICFNEYV